VPVFPVYLAGGRLTAGLLTSGEILEAVKDADQSVTSSTVLVNDTKLTLPVVAGATYDFICYLDFEGGTASSSDLKFQWSVPAGAVLRYACPHVNASGTNVLNNTNTATTSITVQSQGAGVLCGVTCTGTLVMSSTAGSLTLTWAQNTSNGTATIVHAQSKLSLVRTA
jgi:hypothetical protein